MEEQSILELYAQLRDRTRMVDLARRLHGNMPQMSVHPDLSIIHDARNHRQHGYYLQSVLMTEHHGSHVDAPIHVHPEMTDSTIEDVPIDHLMGPYKKLDLSRFDPQPGDLISRAQLQEAEERAGLSVEAGDIVLVDFGWSRFYLPEEPDWAKRRYWADFNAGLAEDACDHLASKGIKAICSDTVACDISLVGGQILTDFGHKTYFLPEGILIGEGFANLDAIAPTGLMLAIPLRIDQGSGSPLRPVALFEPS